MRKRIKTFLVKRKLYYPLKYSWLFHVYQQLFKPGEIKQQQKEVALYRSFLPSCHLIFDIGAYDGHKSVAFLELAEKVVCCEPDEENYKILRARFRNKKERVCLENKAVSDKEGDAEYHIHHAGSAFNTLSPKWMKLLEEDNREKWDETIKFSETRKVATTTLDLLIKKYGLPDFVKIDVEGFEQSVLGGLSQPVKYLSFETLLPDYGMEMKSCLDRIGQLDRSATYNVVKNEMLLFPDFVKLNALEEWAEINKNSILSFEIIVKMSA